MNPKTVQYKIPVYRLQLVQEGHTTTSPVTGPAEIAVHLKEVATSDREQMVVIFLNTKNRPIGQQVVSIGTLNATLVEPREVFKGALLANANSVILAHNHPSGDLTPSPDDNAVTQRIARAGMLLNIRLLDHVILAPDGGFHSYKERQPEYLDGNNH